MIKAFRMPCCILAALMLLFFLPAAVWADEYDTKVYDYGELLSDEEESRLEQLSQEYGKKAKADLVIVTTGTDNTTDCEVFLEDLYDEVGFGYDKEYGDTVMIIVDMRTREVCIEGYGLAQTRVDQSRGDWIRSKITPKLTAGNYYDAFTQFLKLSAKCMRLKVSLNPDSLLLNPIAHLFLALAIGAAAVGSMMYTSQGRTTTDKTTYLNQADSRIVARRDDYVRTTTTRVKKPESNSGGGRSGGGGGGTSSGGHSHSTSRGGF